MTYSRKDLANYDNLYLAWKKIQTSTEYRYKYLCEKGFNAFVSNNISMYFSVAFLWFFFIFPTYFLPTKKIQNDFISAVVTVRNKLTHLDDNFSVSSLIDYRELNRLCDFVKALLRICLMNLLEIDKKVIKSSIERFLKKWQ